MRRRVALLSLSLLLGVACSDRIDTAEPWELDELEPEPEPEPQPEPEPEPRFDDRFVGTWLVHDNVPRGGITADIYRFAEDGTLELIDQYDPAGVVVACPTGLPADECTRIENSLSCRFGQRWESEGSEVLRIEGECSDGTARMIELSFPESVLTNSVTPGTEAELVSVDGDPDSWVARTFAGAGRGFFFERCLDDGPGPGSCTLP